MTLAERLASELGARVGEVDGRKIVPMLCGRDETGERVLSQSGWIFELKLDGVRIIADKRKDRVTLCYRKLRDATASYPEIAEAIAKLDEERLVLDGEIVAFDAEGRPDFQRLGTRIQRQGAEARRAAARVPVVFVVFDVLAIGDRDVTGLPIEARKAILEQVLVDPSRTNGLVRLHPTFPDGERLFRLCREQGLEGVVAKRAGSVYRPDERSSNWVKVKCELEADLVVIGWTEGEGTRTRLGALDVGAYDGDRLIIRGRVGSGLTEEIIEAIYDRLVALEVPRSPAEGKPKPKRVRHHVRPEIVVSVRHMGVSNEGLLRFPVFRGLRPDLSPEDCTLDAVVTPASLATSTSFSSETPPREAASRVRLTAPSTQALPDGTKKGALYKYYEAVAPAILPYLRGRTCPLLRAQAGPPARSRLVPLWPLPTWTPSWVRASVIPGAGEEMRGVIVEDVDTLRFLVEAGGASLQMTAMREGAPGTADFIALAVAGAGASRVALQARELVAEMGLTAFVKRTGSGLDVLVAVSDAPAEAAQVLGTLLARLLAQAAADASATVEQLDAPIAPYGLALPLDEGAPVTVSLPLAWESLERGETPAARVSLDRVAAEVAAGAPDPMQALLGLRVDFAHAVRTIERMVAAGGWAGG